MHKLLIKESNFIRFCQNDTPPKRNTSHGPLKPHLEKKLKKSESTFCRLQKQSQRVFINTKNVPWIFSPLKGFLVTCPIPLIVFRSTFRTSELQSLKRLPKSIPVKIKPPLTFFKGIVSFFPLHRYYPCWKFNVHGVNLYPFTMITTSIGHQNFRCYVLTKFFLPCSSIPI